MGILHKDSEPSAIRRFLSHYTYSQKFNLIAVIVGVVMTLIMYLLISNQLEDINFAKLEIKGNEYQSTIQTLIEDVNKHRIISNRYLGGDQAQKSDLLDTQNKANVDFNTLLVLNNSLEKELKTRPEDFAAREEHDMAPSQIYTKWKDLVSGVNKNSPEPMDQKHTAIINSFQNLLRTISDTSNMTYDYEVETHYLMESALRFLPEEQELISTLIVTGENILKREKVEQEEKYQISTLISLLLSSVAITEQSIQKSIVEDTVVNKRLETKSNLSEPLIDYKQSIVDLVNYIQKSLLVDSTPADQNIEEKTQILNDRLTEFNFLGMTALSKNTLLTHSLTNQVDTLLKWRVSSIELKGMLVTGFAILALGFVVFISTLILSETNYFFREVYSAVTKFAEGDLKARAPIAYDKAFEKMRLVLNNLGDSIEELVEQLHKSGVQLTTTTTQIASAAKHQEGTVCQQEATVKQILVTASEISETARDFAITMNDVSLSAEETSQLAASGKEGVSQMESSMHQMVKASKNIASKLAVLNEKAGAITSVITTITKVADQTNLLSLNASIEAEKAGEHGKSFAVIAREIRRLADQTANATLDIEKMITEMMSAVSEGVMGVDKFSVEIKTGAEHVSTVSEQLTQIIERVQQQTVSYESVNKGVQAQSLGAEQINDSIMQLSDAAQETTSSIRQFHTAIEQLNYATKEMQSCVARIKK